MDCPSGVTTSCTHREDAGVRCTGKVIVTRLVKTSLAQIFLLRIACNSCVFVVNSALTLILIVLFFFIVDITPPTLRFINAPYYSNSHVTFSWVYSEEASSLCTLQSPSEISMVPCNQSVTLTNLREGLHTLYIQATDLAGNVARTVRRSWTVGESITQRLLIVSESSAKLSTCFHTQSKYQI